MNIKKNEKRAETKNNKKGNRERTEKKKGGLQRNGKKVLVKERYNSRPDMNTFKKKHSSISDIEAAAAAVIARSRQSENDEELHPTAADADNLNIRRQRCSTGQF